MTDIWWLILGFVAVFGSLYLGWRVVRAIEVLVHYGRGKEVRTTAWVPSQAKSQSSQECEDAQSRKLKAPELPPETIAPYLKNPPKSAGFVNNNHGSAQQEPPDSKRED